MANVAIVATWYVHSPDKKFCLSANSPMLLKGIILDLPGLMSLVIHKILDPFGVYSLLRSMMA